MAAAAMKHMASNFAKLDKFEGVDFRRWQKKMHFLLSSMSVIYVLTTPIPEDHGDDATMEQVRRRAKWDNDDYVCRGLILNGMTDSLFDIYQNVESAKELWDSLEAKYMAEDASSKKFLVSNFTNYKMTDSRPVMEQYNELLGILGRFTQHNMNMDEAIQVSCIIDKLPPSWKDFKHTLKHKKEDLTLVELGSHLRIEESLKVQDSDKPKSNNVAGPSVVNMVEHNHSTRNNDNKGKRKHHDNTRADPNKKAKPTCWKCGKSGHIKRDCKGVNVGNKANGSGTKGQNMFNESSQVYYVTYVSEAYFVQDDDVAWWIDSGATTHVCKDRCWFKTYESLDDGSILHMGNESTALVHGRGCVDLKFSSGKIVSLFNVLHVPNIRKNLVSSSILNNCGYKQVIESNKFVLSKHGVFIGFGYLSNQMFRLNIVNNDDIASAFMSTSKLNDSILWHARLGHVHYKRMQDMSKDGLIPAFDMDTEKCKTCMLTKITKKPFQDVKRETKVLELIHSDLCDLHATPSLGNKKYFVTFIDDASRFCYVYLLHSKDEALDKFKVFKTEVELQQGSLIKRFRTDRGGEYMDTLYFQSVGIIHETTAPYTPQQNGISERKNRVLKEMVNSMLSYSGLSQGFWGEAMLTACYLLNRVPNKRNKVTPYELWTKREPNLNYLRVWGCRAVVRLPDPKLKTLGERGIECIFVGYAEHSKAYRFYVIEPNESVSINSIIESRDAIFDENRFSSVPRPSQMSLKDGTEDIGVSVVPEVTTDEVVQQPEPELRKSKRHRTPKNFGPEFQLYLIEGTRNEVSDQYSYCFVVEGDPNTFEEAMKSQDVAFWKEAINDEMDSIMGNNTWVLVDLPPGCKPLGCKWIFKRKMKVDGTIEKFKARLVIQGFRQKSGIDYFDTYAPVARISTIRLLIALASIHNLIIHQMDVKTAFLNGDLDEEVYMNQPQGFIMPGNENKVCKLVKSLYGLKQAPKQWHQKFDEVVLSNGYLLNQADKCVYSKFDESGKGVIICLYVDDMLIFGTDQDHVDKTKEFLSSRFSMKDMGEADVILGIRIKHESNGISISQSHYIEKVLKKFNYFDCTPVSTPMDTSEKLMPNNGHAVSQLEYSRVIGCLMYAMTCTRPDIAFAVGKLSRYTSNPSTQHWQAIHRVLKYLKKTMDYSLTYTGYPSVLEGYTDASWISNTEDNSSTSGWVFLLGGGAISWASKKQTCITSSTMESEFVALAAAGKEAEWLKNLLLEIPLWFKPMAPISIRCDSAATLAKAYSQMYNGKSRHLGVRHSMIRELIMNGVISIEFVRSQQNLADHLTKGLARDLVIKSAKGMGLKSNLVTEH